MKLLPILLAIALGTPAAAQPPQSAQPFTVTLTPEQINVIGAALDEVPGKYGRPVYENLVQQIAAAQAKRAAEKGGAEKQAALHGAKPK